MSCTVFLVCVIILRGRILRKRRESDKGERRRERKMINERIKEIERKIYVQKI